MSYANNNRLTSYTDSGPGPNKSLSYDSRGNVTALGSLNFVYDYADQPRSVSGSVSGNYTYDGNFKRVKNTVGGPTIYTVYDASGSLVHIDDLGAGDETDYVSGAGMTLARIENNAVTYLHNDHLGSAAAGTNSSGSVLWTPHYTPFGEEWNAVAANDDQAGFTGHIKDKATGLNYMQQRLQDPNTGRFLSIDPVTFMKTDNPGMFNRYTYAFNNPIMHIDPDGREAKEKQEEEKTPRERALEELGLPDPSAGVRENAENVANAAETVSETVDILVTPDASDIAALAAGGPLAVIANRANKLRKALKTAENGDDLKQVRRAQAELAESLGYNHRIPANKAPFNSHGQPVFSDGKRYISPDVDSHNVTAGWKAFDRKGRRTGTWNAEMTERLKD